MANSTFSGPVRSQNGFQEWDGSAWVPVGGGGGGGSSNAIILERTASTVGIELPKTTIGQTVTYVLDPYTNPQQYGGSYQFGYPSQFSIVGVELQIIAGNVVSSLINVGGSPGGYAWNFYAPSGSGFKYTSQATFTYVGLISGYDIWNVNAITVEYPLS